MSKLLKSKFLFGALVVTIMFVGVVAISAETASADCSITSTLRVGSTGAEVVCLQTALGGLTADGSFGPKTKAAVVAWQAKEGLVADGIFGPKSNAVWVSNAGNSANFPAGCSSTVGFSSTTGLPCSTPVSTGFTPAGCTSASGYSPVTGGACQLASGLPAGCTSTVGFSPTTGASCSGGTVIIPGSTGEGSITLDYDAIPAANVVISKGLVDQSAIGFKVKATGSNMNVSRVWLDFNARLWLYADTASLWDGSTMLASTALSSSAFSEVTAGSKWQLQFNSLNVNVAPGTTKVLTLKISRPTLTQTSGVVTLQITSSVRATDGAGFSNTYSPTATRAINLTATAATAGTLTTSLNVNTPAVQSVANLSATAGVLTPVKLMDFNLKAEDSALNVTSIDISSLTTSAVTLTNQVASLELRDGTSVLSSVTGAANPDAFASLNIDIPQDTTKTLSVWAQMNPIAAADASGYTVKGAGITAVLDSSAIVATDAAFNTMTITSADITSNIQYMYQYAPIITLGAVSAASVEGSAVGKKQGNYSIAFSVTAPSGSDIYVDRTVTATVDTGVGKTVAGKGGTLVTTSTVSGVASVGASSGYDKVSAGTSRTFTITGTVPDGVSAGFTGMKMLLIKWTDTDNTTTPTPISQDWGLSDFKTAEVYVTA